MNRRTQCQELEAAMLARMEATRTELLAANVSLRIRDHASKRGDNALTLWNISRALSAAPTVTLLGSVTLGSILVGPKHVLPVVLRKGLIGLIARNIRTVAAR